MNVSAKSEYGLRSLIVLAHRASEGLVPARQIAEACGVPLKYLEQILKALREGGLVEGQVGAAGGYRLTRPPRFITAGDAIRLLDERLGLADLPGEGRAATGSTPGLQRLWTRVEGAIADVLYSTTLADLCADEEPDLARRPAVS
ncbi:MAG TPA: Rrf2 family transcriptional regulator [Gemmatimonadota bacterium]|nr:Rrf2 family transcriptional regulator [Gemmatimonadota bacterium]